MRERKRRSTIMQGRIALQVERAVKLLGDFTGRDASVARLRKPVYPDVVMVIGECDGVLYTADRDGELQKYVHEFSSKARPLLCCDPDGKVLYLLGGAYNFTARGIEDA